MTEETKQEMMGIHWLSNAIWAPSGYGVQTKLFLPRIKALGYSVSSTAFYGLQGQVTNVKGINVFPVGMHPWGMDVAAANTNVMDASILITLMDAWVCEPGMLQATRWIPWFPIDSEPLAPLIRERVSAAFDRIVFSKFGCRMMDQAGLSYHYVPHGVDTKIFFPGEGGLKNMNEHLTNKLPADHFIVSMVAANKGAPSRKAFCENIRAFAELHKKHPDTTLYLHTTDGAHGEYGGVNLVEFINCVGLKVNRDVFFPDLQGLINGYPDVFINAVYNASDVLLSVSMGEGFGIPIVEAQAAGCPVIVGDWTSMGELCFGGWKVDKKDSAPVWTQLANYMYSPRWEAIYEKLEAAYLMKGNQDYRKRARDGALAYDADKVTSKYWAPVLKEIQEKVQNSESKMELVTF